MATKESTMDEEQHQQQQQKRVPEKQTVAATTATLEHQEGGSNSSDNNASTSTTLATASTLTTIAASASPAAAASCAWEERVQLVREHYERKGYRVRSGLQFGCELVLYADDLGSVHSDFCIHVVPQDGYLDWRQMQSLVRSMPALRKTLILANLVPVDAAPKQGADDDEGSKRKKGQELENENAMVKKTNANIRYRVQELALASEHAPFRLRNRSGAGLPTQVGAQKKRKKAENIVHVASDIPKTS